MKGLGFRLESLRMLGLLAGLMRVRVRGLWLYMCAMGVGSTTHIRGGVT